MAHSKHNVQPAGWTGKFLRVDLGDGRIYDQDSLPYAPYLGGRGFGSRLAWEEIPPGVGALDPENLLMFLSGPLTGTTAPTSGRGEVCGLGPQGWPVDWFTRSGMGGHWAPEMKYAGYDGIIVRGKADKPVYLLVQDGKAEIKNASRLWGLGTYETQQVLMAEHGKSARVLTIGQAGERLSRIAIINTETESAAGQGGFGAVMGSKNLKAVVIRGTGSVRLGRPEEFTRRTLAITKELHGPHGSPRPSKLRPELAKYGEKYDACSQQCTVQGCDCRYFTNVPGVVYGGINKGQLHCVSPVFQGFGQGLWDWKIGFEAGFEMAKLTNDWGLNHWDILVGMVPWLRDSMRAGLVEDLDGLTIDLNSPHFWAEMIRKMAFREGYWGEALSEGGWRASLLTGVGKEIAERYFPGWGYSGHWDGHVCNKSVFPYWLVPAIQWAIDTRDPMSSGHGYVQNIMQWAPIHPDGGHITWEQMRAIAIRMYGEESADAFDPHSGYAAKAVPAIWHTNRSVIKDSMLVDDNVFPRFFSIKTEDRYSRAGDMEGPQFEYHMFVSATGLDWSEEEFDAAADRVLCLDRAVNIRNFGRSRKDDESIIPYFSTTETWENPVLGEKHGLDAEQFRGLLSDFYSRRGWDVATGAPSRARLESLDMKDVADELEKEPAGA